jgi:hypothetical protein
VAPSVVVPKISTFAAEVVSASQTFVELQEMANTSGTAPAFATDCEAAADTAEEGPAIRSAAMTSVATPIELVEPSFCVWVA